jgi:hypothetical protein
MSSPRRPILFAVITLRKHLRGVPRHEHNVPRRNRAFDDFRRTHYSQHRKNDTPTMSVAMTNATETSSTLTRRRPPVIIVFMIAFPFALAVDYGTGKSVIFAKTYARFTPISTSFSIKGLRAYPGCRAVAPDCDVRKSDSRDFARR